MVRCYVRSAMHPRITLVHQGRNKHVAVQLALGYGNVNLDNLCIVKHFYVQKFLQLVLCCFG